MHRRLSNVQNSTEEIHYMINLQQISQNNRGPVFRLQDPKQQRTCNLSCLNALFPLLAPSLSANHDQHRPVTASASGLGRPESKETWF